MRFLPCAMTLMGALLFAVDVSAGDVLLSTSPLSSPATGAALLPEEPFVCPLRSKDRDIVSPFGKRNVVIPSTASAAGAIHSKAEMHEGVDYSVNPGTEVRAARSGKVLFAGFSKSYVSRMNKNDQHRLVIIRHADGESSRYVHLSGLRVRPGQDVKSGQVLGVVTESDEWVAPVFHFEIRTVGGRPINPETVIKDETR